MNPEESLDIITRMVSDTRRSILQQSYLPFITWGTVTIVVGMLVYFLVKSTGDFRCYYCWLLLPLIGAPLTKRFQPSTKLPRTGITTSLKSIWAMLAVLLAAFTVASFIISFNIMFIILLLLSIGSYVTGAIISYPFLKYSSIVGFVGALILMFFVWGVDQLPIFSAAVSVMMIIPGIKMKRDLNI